MPNLFNPRSLIDRNNLSNALVSGADTEIVRIQTELPVVLTSAF